jgi:hypothetical protein
MKMDRGWRVPHLRDKIFTRGVPNLFDLDKLSIREMRMLYISGGNAES